MSRLAPGDFARYFKQVHGAEPFPWQQRLADLVFTGGWPPALDVPTGAGKTAAIDVAVFHLALEADRGEARAAPARVLFVVDRRLVVDDAERRARKIEAALRGATSGVLATMRERLARLAESGDRPLVVSKLRGGAPLDRDWVRTPCQPAVVVSTVDQVGSRFLFRGYGVSDSMRPIHAGLLGQDALYLLDEAHLSQPFVQTVRGSRRYQEPGPWSEDASPAPLQIVTLSATQAERAPVLVKKDDREHETLGRRLKASKPARLVLTREAPGSAPWVEELAGIAWSLSASGGGASSVVAVVVNRVRRARSIASTLRELAAKVADPPEVALLVGRSRPLDREALLGRILPRMAMGRAEEAGARPLILVATQCVEAGADLDFDALVTELAPLDCLRQRFGRLNRGGRDIETRAVIVASTNDIGARADPDPIYALAPRATWKLLEAAAEREGKRKSQSLIVDFGVEAARRWLPEGDALLECLAPRVDAPILLPAFVEELACTSPPSSCSPEVSLFLHGPRSGPEDVQIVWRADVREGEELAAEKLAACPPSPLEAVSVRPWEARRWLEGRDQADVADVEMEPEAATPAGESTRRLGAHLALLWLGPDHGTRWIAASRIRPGQMIVVPASYGGLDGDGQWDPASTDPVPDRAEVAILRSRGLAVLRLSPELAVLRAAEDPSGPAATKVRAAVERLVEDGTNERTAWFARAMPGEEALPSAWRTWFEEVERPRIERSSTGQPLTLVGLPRRAEPMAEDAGASGESVTETDASSRGVREVLLTDHSEGVRSHAERFAEQAALPPAVQADIALAAFLHDAGKAHPSFQQWLRGGDELAAADGKVLAKSGRVLLGEGAHLRSGLPRGARHEVGSVLFALSHPKLATARDPDLVLWLVGTHHGQGRPFFPPVQWPSTGDTFVADVGDGARTSTPMPAISSLGARWLDLRARLHRRYGLWGLARLEALVRLADHRRSEDEQRRSNEPPRVQWPSAD